jgi:hypothetical protein
MSCTRDSNYQNPNGISPNTIVKRGHKYKPINPNFTPTIIRLSNSKGLITETKLITIYGSGFIHPSISTTYVNFGKEYQKIPTNYYNSSRISFTVPYNLLAGTFPIVVVTVYNENYKEKLYSSYSPNNVFYSNALNYTSEYPFTITPNLGNYQIFSNTRSMYNLIIVFTQNSVINFMNNVRDFGYFIVGGGGGGAGATISPVQKNTKSFNALLSNNFISTPFKQLNGGGGGGGGGVLTGNCSINIGIDYQIHIGAGGGGGIKDISGNKGFDSSFNNFIAPGGFGGNVNGNGGNSGNGNPGGIIGTFIGTFNGIDKTIEYGSSGVNGGGGAGFVDVSNSYVSIPNTDGGLGYIFEYFNYYGNGGLGGCLDNGTVIQPFNNGNGGNGGDISGNHIIGDKGNPGVIILYFKFDISTQ